MPVVADMLPPQTNIHDSWGRLNSELNCGVKQVRAGGSCLLSGARGPPGRRRRPTQRHVSTCTLLTTGNVRPAFNAADDRTVHGPLPQVRPRPRAAMYLCTPRRALVLDADIEK